MAADTWVTAIGTAVAAAAAVGAAMIALVQLKKLRDQIKQSSDLDRRRNTLDACQRFEKDELLHQAMKSLWKTTNRGTDYTKLTSENDFDVLTVLNYFEGIAIGIAERVYKEKMARDYLEDSLTKAVRALIYGQSGDGWKAERPIFPDKNFPVLAKLYRAWNAKSHFPQAQQKRSANPH
jgi:hypothetical protein